MTLIHTLRVGQLGIYNDLRRYLNVFRNRGIVKDTRNYVHTWGFFPNLHVTWAILRRLARSYLHFDTTNGTYYYLRVTLQVLHTTNGNVSTTYNYWGLRDTFNGRFNATRYGSTKRLRRRVNATLCHTKNTLPFTWGNELTTLRGTSTRSSGSQLLHRSLYFLCVV